MSGNDSGAIILKESLQQGTRIVSWPSDTLHVTWPNGVGYVFYFILHCVLNITFLRAIIAHICLLLAGFPFVRFQPHRALHQHEIGSASNLYSIVTSSLINVETDQKPREQFSLILASPGGAFILARKCADFARTWRRKSSR